MGRLEYSENMMSIVETDDYGIGFSSRANGGGAEVEDVSNDGGVASKIVSNQDVNDGTNPIDQISSSDSVGILNGSTPINLERESFENPYKMEKYSWKKKKNVELYWT